MKSILQLWALLLLSVNSFGAIKKLNLLDAHQQNLVTFSVARTDKNYNEKGLKLTINNLSKKNILITIDPALIFEPNDTSYQDLIISGSEMLVVQSGKSNSIDLQTYCAKSYAAGPNQQVLFTYKKQGDSTIIKTLNYMRQILASNDLAQRAVWFLLEKDSRILNTVYDSKQPNQSQLLISFISKLLNMPIPGYYVETAINTRPDEPVAPPKILSLHLTFEWEQQEVEELNLSIFDSNNKKIESYFENKKMVLGLYKLNARFETSMYEEGNYTVQLYNNSGKVIKETSVRLE